MSQNKVIILLAQLIVINIFVIINIILNEPQKDPITYDSKVVANQPKITFGDILAKVAETPTVLGVQTTPIPSLEPQPAIKKLSKDKYVIAVIGDSMEETMGGSLDYLQKSLKEKYPQTKFDMYNYGIGSEKVSDGLQRITKQFNRDDRHYPPLSELKPDILIVGSYAYNPFDVHNPQDHHNKLAELVNQARNISGKTYILAEISPVENNFGIGPGGVNWPSDLASKHTQKIIDQMQNAITISKELTVPLINVFELSRKPNSIFGKNQYVSTHDNIHPSILGQIFTASIIANNLSFD